MTKPRYRLSPNTSKYQHGPSTSGVTQYLLFCGWNMSLTLHFHLKLQYVDMHLIQASLTPQRQLQKSENFYDNFSATKRMRGDFFATFSRGNQKNVFLTLR